MEGGKEGGRREKGGRGREGEGGEEGRGREGGTDRRSDRQTERKCIGYLTTNSSK